nr:DUF4118 domain-containing protein [Dyella sp. ASV21]
MPWLASRASWLGRAWDFERGVVGGTPWRGLLPALLACGAATLLAALLLRVFDLSNVVILFLFTVVLVSLRWGRMAGAVAALLGVVSFDFFFVPPIFSFHVSDTQYLFTFTLTLVVGLVTGQLAARLREEAASAAAGEQRATALASIASQLSAASSVEEVQAVCAQAMAPMFDAQGYLWFSRHADMRTPMVEGFDEAVAHWVGEHARSAPCASVSSGAWYRYVPLISPMGAGGVLVWRGDALASSLGHEQQRLLEACSALIGQALVRIHFADMAREAQVRVEGERFRHTLLAAVSHDLKTPLTAIRGMAETLELADALPVGDRVAVAGAIRHQADALHRQVINLLDLARIQGHGVCLYPEWHAIGEVVESALASAAASLGERCIHVTLDADLPLVQLDAALFERVLANLLDNAAKYTPCDACVEVGARVHEGALHLYVEDDGPGLPAGVDAESLFAPFARGVQESAISGVGLGLALCRSIVEAHGGVMDAQAREPTGVRFAIHVPLHRPPMVEPEPQ